MAAIMGETGDSGHSPGLDQMAFLTSRQERFAMQLRGRLPDSRSGLITGDFANRKVSQTAFVSRDENHKRVIFFATRLLSEPDLRLFL